MTNNQPDLCALVRELLPLYADGVLREDARRQVEEHLAGCSGCRQALEDAGGALPPLPAPPVGGEKRLFGRLRRVRLSACWLLCLLVWPVCMGLMLLTSGLVCTGAREYLGGRVEGGGGAGRRERRGGQGRGARGRGGGGRPLPGGSESRFSRACLSPRR